MMKISGGHLRGRSLKPPKGRDIRPTSDKVRQAIFNMLNARGGVAGARVLDAFCGSGALGLEALSQGADFFFFFDTSPASVAFCRENVALLQLEECIKISLQDATKPSKKPQETGRIDLVFLDPPYGKDLLFRTIQRLLQDGWIEDKSLFLLEMGAKENPDICGLTVLQEKTYGDTKIILAQSTPE